MGGRDAASLAAPAGGHRAARRGPGSRGGRWPGGIRGRGYGREHSADPGRTRVSAARHRHRLAGRCCRLPAPRGFRRRDSRQRGRFYIWPGVPRDLPGAVRFFATRGWQHSHDTLDLVTDLRRYRPPPGAYQNAATKGITITRPGSAGFAAVLAFEAATFPSWTRWFAVSGPAAGTIGCVGVAAPRQGEGIGTALLARASETLRDAGTRTCHIGWTTRESFYRRAGYQPWRRYAMFTRPEPPLRRPMTASSPDHCSPGSARRRRRRR